MPQQARPGNTHGAESSFDMLSTSSNVKNDGPPQQGGPLSLSADSPASSASIPASCVRRSQESRASAKELPYRIVTSDSVLAINVTASARMTS